MKKKNHKKQKTKETNATFKLITLEEKRKREQEYYDRLRDAHLADNGMPDNEVGGRCM